MPSIQWNSRYATGIPEIDAQHKNLVEHIEKLQHSLETGQTQAESKELMQFLIQYVDEHFTTEEAYMEQIHYPDLTQHRKLHDQLRVRVTAMNDLLNHGKDCSPTELALLLFHWLRDHILHDDFSYVAHAREQSELAG